MPAPDIAAAEGSATGEVVPALHAANISVRFGGLMALADVSLEVQPGKVAGLVGPNGAGKSTLLSVLSGLRRPNAGEVWLRGEDVTLASARSRAIQGLARTFQQPELFMGLTVREHLVLAYRARTSPHRLWRDMVDPRSLLPPAPAENERVDGLLEVLKLTRVARSPVAALPLGLLRLVEVGRALASDPYVLLLDEPLSGLDMHASENLLTVFREIVEQSDHGLSIVIVEHDVGAVLSLSDTVFVLDFGERIAVGSPEEIRINPEVQKAYLGDGDQPQQSAGAARPRARESLERAKTTEPLLKVRDIDVRYGTSQALFEVSVDVDPGTVMAVLGVNGAGKSTLARAISGLVAPTAGRVDFDGHDVTAWAPYRIRKLGLTYIPEGRGIFPGLSVTENLRMAVAQEPRSDRSAAIDRAIEHFPVLGKRGAQRAGSLSGGEQQMLALARALAVSPKLIIADEMSLGLAPLIAESVFEGLERARRSGITIMLIEQFVHRALSMADSCVILTRGRSGWCGPASDAGQEIIDRYLGEVDVPKPN
jgi:ABC-type branched-subunit amino acid transport system ATPase component